MIVVYDCTCLIFQFKTGVKLKWGRVEPLVHCNFWQLEKTIEKACNNFGG
jgi:hypothetical protein